MSESFGGSFNLDTDEVVSAAPETGDPAVDAAIRRLAGTTIGPADASHSTMSAAPGDPSAKDGSTEDASTEDGSDDPDAARALDEALEAGEALHRSLVTRLADLGS